MSLRLVILSWDDPTYEHVIATDNDDEAGMRHLERVERGANINLRDDFYTEIQTVTE